MITLVTSTVAFAADFDPSFVHAVAPLRTGMYQGISIPDTEWLCPGARDVVETTSAAALPESARDADCWVIRDSSRGRVVAERSAPRVIALRTEVDQDAEYRWASSRAMELLASFGLDSGQFGSIEPRFVGRIDSDTPDVKMVMGIVVFIDRTIEGVPVAGDHAVVSFDLDHSVRGVKATWPSIDVDRSTWSLPEDGTCSVGGSLTWAEREVEPSAAGRVTLQPVFVRPDSDQASVRLTVVSDTVIHALDGETKHQVRECGGMGEQ